MASSVTHQQHDQEFTIQQQGHAAELAYSLPESDIIDFTHTYVDEPLRGKGIGEKLAEAALTYARQQKLRVRTSCPFMQQYVERHPEYTDLLDSRS